MPLIVLLLLMPYFILDSYQHSKRVARLIEYISNRSPDFDRMSQLVRGPVRPFHGVLAEDVRQPDPPNYKGFNVLQDARIIDLRSWNPTNAGDSTSFVYGYRRLKVQKAESDGNDVFPGRHRAAGYLAGSASFRVAEKFPSAIPPKSADPLMLLSAIVPD